MLKAKLRKLILFIFFALVSCTKQGPPEAKPDIDKEVLEYRRLKACSRTNFEEGLLEKKNWENLFVCSKWDALFPKMYEGLKQVPQKSWNHIFMPIGKEFLDNKTNRNHLIKNIKSLGSDGIEDLDQILKVINGVGENGKSLYYNIGQFFECVENNKKENCSNANSITLTKKDIIDALKILDFRKDEVKIFYELWSSVIPIIAKQENDIKELSLKLLANGKFLEKRLTYSNSIAGNFIVGIPVWENLFISNLFLMPEEKGNKPFMHKYFQELSQDEFNESVRDYTVENPTMYKDIFGLKKMTKKGLNCKKPIKMNMALKPSLDIFFKTVKDGSLSDLLTELSKGLLNVKVGENFCEEVDTFKISEGGSWIKGHEVKLNDVVKSSLKIYGHEQNYTLLRFFNHIVTNVLKVDPVILLDHFGGVGYFSLFSLIMEIQKVDPSSLSIALKFIKGLSVDDFKRLGLILKVITDNKKGSEYQSLSKVWTIWQREEKNHLFKIFDSHFEKSIDTEALFNFYLLTFKQLIISSESISMSWFGDEKREEDTFDSYKNILKEFSGNDVLVDMRNFFSADHILKIIKIIVDGEKIKEEAIEELKRVDLNIMQEALGRIPFRHREEELSSEEKQFISCLRKISETDFHGNIESFPKICGRLVDRSIAVKAIFWLNNFNSDYKEALGIDVDILDKKGMFARGHIAQIVALAHLVEKHSKNGFKAFFTGIKRFYEYKNNDTYKKLEDFISTIESIFSFNFDESRIYRNELLFELSKEKNAKRSKEYVEDLLKVLTNYSRNYTGEEFKFEIDPKYNCENYNNLETGGFPCPDNVILKAMMNKILKDMRSRYAEDLPTAGANLVWSLKSDEGMLIPFNRKNQKKYPIKFSETLKLLFELSDKSLQINNLEIPFKSDVESDRRYALRVEEDYSNELDDENNDEESSDGEIGEIIRKRDGSMLEDSQEKEFDKVKMTTLERVEIVVKDVKFDENYLGAHYKNSVAASEDYDKTVKSKYKLIKFCSGVKFCGKFMNKNQRRMAKNAVSTFPSLMDVNRNDEEGQNWRYGDYMKSLLTTLVSSSSKKSQKDSLLRIKIFGTTIEVPKIQSKKVLRKHNGKLLTKISMLSVFSNVSRLLRMRVGEDKQELLKFLNSKRFKIVEDNFLRGLERDETDEIINSLIRKLEGQPIDDLVEFFYSFDFINSRLSENLISHMLLTSSFIGVPKHYEVYAKNDPKIERYREQNVLNFLKYVDKLIIYWDKFTPYFSHDKSINIMKSLNRFLEFFNNGLMSEFDNPGPFYRVLNESYILIQKVLDEKLGDSISGMELLTSLIENKKDGVKNLMDLGDHLYDLADYLHIKDGDEIKLGVITKNIAAILNGKGFNLSIFRNYLTMTTGPILCEEVDGVICRKNDHYDEIFNIFKYLSIKKDNETNLNKLFKNVLVDEGERLSKLLQDILPTISLK